MPGTVENGVFDPYGTVQGSPYTTANTTQPVSGNRAVGQFYFQNPNQKSPNFQQTNPQAPDYIDPSVQLTPGGAGQPTTGAPAATSINFGGGWDQAASDPGASALEQALRLGLTGQKAVDWVNANTPYNGQIAYYPQNGTYGAPGWYAAPGAGGALDLIKRAGGGGGGVGAPGGLGGAYVPGQGVPGQGTVFGANNPLTGQVNDLESTLAGIYSGTAPIENNPSLQIDPTGDKVIQSQLQPFAAEQQLGIRNTLAQLAENNPNSPLAAETMALGEKAGLNTAAYEGQLLQNELAARRQEIQQALQSKQGLLTQEQQMQLQEELSQIANAQQAYQYDTSAAYGVQG